jgi:hypothetical protein
MTAQLGSRVAPVRPRSGREQACTRCAHEMCEMSRVPYPFV